MAGIQFYQDLYDRSVTLGSIPVRLKLKALREAKEAKDKDSYFVRFRELIDRVENEEYALKSILDSLKLQAEFVFNSYTSKSKINEKELTEIQARYKQLEDAFYSQQEKLQKVILEVETKITSELATIPELTQPENEEKQAAPEDVVVKVADEHKEKDKPKDAPKEEKKSEPIKDAKKLLKKAQFAQNLLWFDFKPGVSLLQRAGYLLGHLEMTAGGKDKRARDIYATQSEVVIYADLLAAINTYQNALKISEEDAIQAYVRLQEKCTYYYKKLMEDYYSENLHRTYEKFNTADVYGATKEKEIESLTTKFSARKAELTAGYELKRIDAEEKSEEKAASILVNLKPEAKQAEIAAGEAETAFYTVSLQLAEERVKQASDKLERIDKKLEYISEELARLDAEIKELEEKSGIKLSSLPPIDDSKDEVSKYSIELEEKLKTYDHPDEPAQAAIIQKMETEVKDAERAKQATKQEAEKLSRKVQETESKIADELNAKKKQINRDEKTALARESAELTAVQLEYDKYKELTSGKNPIFEKFLSDQIAQFASAKKLGAAPESKNPEFKIVREMFPEKDFEAAKILAQDLLGSSNAHKLEAFLANTQAISSKVDLIAVKGIEQYEEYSAASVQYKEIVGKIKSEILLFMKRKSDLNENELIKTKKDLLELIFKYQQYEKMCQIIIADGTPAIVHKAASDKSVARKWMKSEIDHALALRLANLDRTGKVDYLTYYLTHEINAAALQTLEKKLAFKLKGGFNGADLTFSQKFRKKYGKKEDGALVDYFKADSPVQQPCITMLSLLQSNVQEAEQRYNTEQTRWFRKDLDAIEDARKKCVAAQTALDNAIKVVCDHIIVEKHLIKRKMEDAQVNFPEMPEVPLFKKWFGRNKLRKPEIEIKSKRDQRSGSTEAIIEDFGKASATPEAKVTAGERSRSAAQLLPRSHSASDPSQLVRQASVYDLMRGQPDSKGEEKDKGKKKIDIKKATLRVGQFAHSSADLLLNGKKSKKSKLKASLDILEEEGDGDGERPQPPRESKKSG